MDKWVKRPVAVALDWGLGEPGDKKTKEVKPKHKRFSEKYI